MSIVEPGPAAALRSTLPWAGGASGALPVAMPSEPAAAELPLASDEVAGPLPSELSLRRLPVLAPLLPLLLLLGVCIAGMSDPPAPRAGASGSASGTVSRLHIDVRPVPSLPAHVLPRHRTAYDVGGHGGGAAPR